MVKPVSLNGLGLRNGVILVIVFPLDERSLRSRSVRCEVWRLKGYRLILAIPEPHMSFMSMSVFHTSNFQLHTCGLGGPSDHVISGLSRCWAICEAMQMCSAAFCGPGYRVYCTRVGDVVYVLLCGGTKRGQQRDISKAQQLAEQVKEEWKHEED